MHWFRVLIYLPASGIRSTVFAPLCAFVLVKTRAFIFVA
jgi:hypothetical protein